MYVIFTIIVFSCFVITTLFYYKIYEAVRRHTNQIQTLEVQQVQQKSETANATRLRKFAGGTFFIYLAFLVCYLSRICTLVVIIICGTSNTIKGWSLYSITLVFLNSSLNPLIYCWKMKHIRHAVLDILSSFFQENTHMS